MVRRKLKGERKIMHFTLFEIPQYDMETCSCKVFDLLSQ